MLLTDLIVEVRDSTLTRVGQLLPSDLVGATFVTRFNNVGSWSVKLTSDLPLADVLRTPGSGLVVTGPQGTIISGPTVSAKLEQTKDDPQGVWVIDGSDDSILLTERLAYPTPSVSDVTAQINAHDVRTGNAETVLKAYVEDNISLYAGTDRAIAVLDIEADASRGSVVTGRARFDQLQELLYPLAQTGGIGYTIEQNGDLLVFQVYEPIDQTGTIRMDVDNGRLTSAEYVYQSPKATRAIVAGAGVATERLFYEGTSTDSLLAESVWGRRIERFIDDRGSDVAGELIQAADEALVDEGKTIVNLAVTPSDDQNMRYGFEWNLGDKVTVVVGETEASAVVTEVGISIQPDGVRVGATVGTPVAVDFESKLISKVSTQDTRIGNLERNSTGYGVTTIYQPDGGTIGGTQPTFSGPAIEGSFNRFGNMIHFSIRVAFTNITSFGTGQYYLTLPYPVRVAYDFREGCIHDASASTQYQISGHAFAGSSQLILSAADKVGSAVQDVPFTYNNPVTLTTSDSFHIAGTYEINA